MVVVNEFGWFAWIFDFYSLCSWGGLFGLVLLWLVDWLVTWWFLLVLFCLG